MFCDLELCDVGNAAGIPQQQPFHFHCRNPIRNACNMFFISDSVRRFDYPTLLQHNTTHPLAETNVLYKPVSLTRDLVMLTKRTVVFVRHTLFTVTSRTWFWSSVITSLNILYFLLRGTLRLSFLSYALDFKCLFFIVNCWVSTKSTKRRSCLVILRNVSTCNPVSFAPSIRESESDCKKYGFLT
jgi:hypothetical protein